MNLVTFDNLAQRLLSRAEEIRNKKRPSYTVNAIDVLANFKKVGGRHHLDPHTVLRIYQDKQIDGIDTRHLYPEIPASEPDLDRYADIINYALLDYAILIEKQGQRDHDQAGNQALVPSALFPLSNYPTNGWTDHGLGGPCAGTSAAPRAGSFAIGRDFGDEGRS